MNKSNNNSSNNNRQHGTGKKSLIQCCSRGSRQHCTEKNPVQSYPNTLGTTLHR